MFYLPTYTSIDKHALSHQAGRPQISTFLNAVTSPNKAADQAKPQALGPAPQTVSPMQWEEFTRVWNSENLERKTTLPNPNQRLHL